MCLSAGAFVGEKKGRALLTCARSKVYRSLEMNRGNTSSAAMKTFLAAALLVTTAVAAQSAITAADAFAAIKKLEGHWKGPSPMKGDRKSVV